MYSSTVLSSQQSASILLLVVVLETVNVVCILVRNHPVDRTDASTTPPQPIDLFCTLLVLVQQKAVYYVYAEDSYNTVVHYLLRVVLYTSTSSSICSCPESAN